MKVFHIDLPRGLSFSVKPLDYLSCRLLEEANRHEYQQLDLNSYFWDYLTRYDNHSLIEQVYEFNNQLPSYNLYIINKLSNVLHAKSEKLSVSLNPYGANFEDKIKESSKVLKEYLLDSTFGDWFLQFLAQTNVLNININDSDIISLGIDSANGLVLAGFLSNYIKQKYPEKHVVLARHEYENFTLSDCINDLVENKVIFDIFDSITRDSEKRSSSLVGLADYLTLNQESYLTNIVLRDDSQIISKPPTYSDDIDDIHSNNNTEFQKIYFDNTLIPRSKIMYLMSIMGNTCYYGKCSFCVQNNKYKNSKTRLDDELINSCVDRIEYLVNTCHIKSISFLDQAVSPVIIKKLCNKIIERNIKFSWYVRMLFHTSFDDDLIELLSNAGCREILFGMESVNPETLRSMRKVDSGFSNEQRLQFMSKLSKNNIDVCMNIITHFPTESDNDFVNTTGRFLKVCREKLNNITYTINKFSLFRSSEIHLNPTLFNIKHVELQKTHDMQIVYEYIDGYGRNSSDHSKTTDTIYGFIAAKNKNGNKISTPEELSIWINYLKDSSIALYYRRMTGDFIKDCLEIDFSESDICKHYYSIYPAALHHNEKTRLIIGSNSYLGQNLVSKCDLSNTIISSRTNPNEYNQKFDLPFIKQDLEEGCLQLLSAKPEVVDIVSRPLSDDFEINLKFYTNLKSLINTYCNRRHIKGIRFYSTQLVYPTPDNEKRLSSAEVTGPEEVYEYFKLDFEIFLRFVAKKYDVNIEVYRLPLLFGGLITKKQKNIQLIYQWRNSYANGMSWTFDNNKKLSYGNSWLDMDDFTKLISSKVFRNGYDIVNVTSGDFTYKELNECFLAQKENVITENKLCQPLYMPESRFYMENESVLLPKSLCDEVSRII